MNNVWVGTDWHLWSVNSVTDKRHQFRSISNLGRLSDAYAEDIQSDDIFIYLGDLCDPSVTDIKKLKAIVSSIPGYKVLCKGNHDTQDDTFYKEIGFDVVCEICVIHNLVFSHKPVRVPIGYLNIHGHLHTEKMSTLGYQHINAYDSNFFERPMLVDDLIDSAAFQSPEEYAGTDLKHVEEKFEKYTSVENDTYTQIVDLTDMVGLYPVDEAVELPTFKTPEELFKWMKSNIHYSNFTKLKSSDSVVESKSGSCHDQVVFEYNALKTMGKKPKILFFIAYREGSNQGGMTHSLVYYSEGNKIKWFENSWSGMEGIHTYDSLSDLKADIKRLYSNMPDAKNFPELEFKSASISDFDTGMNLGEFVSGIMDETANDPLDEVLFSDITDVQYWENDDDAPKQKKVKQSPLDTDNQGVVAESANSQLLNLFFISSERDLHETEMTPRIPNNYMTENGYEDNKTPRISFSTSIDGCLMGLGKNVSNQMFYVYQPAGKYKVITPTIDQVPDVKITKERWICEPVKLVRVGKIRAIDENGPHDDGIPYAYGKNGEHEARLYHWGWKWIKQFKYDLNESATMNTFPFIFLSQENMNDELYPEGKMLLRNMDDAVQELYLYQRPAGEYYVHNTEPGYYRIIMSPEFSAGYFSTDTINLSAVGKIKVNSDYSWEWIEQYGSDMNEAIGQPMAEAFFPGAGISLHYAENNIQKTAIQEIKSLIKSNKFKGLNPKPYSIEKNTIIIELIGGSQDERESHKNELAVIAKELKGVLTVKYSNEVKTVTNGDGDEGCIYIKLKKNVDMTINESASDPVTLYHGSPRMFKIAKVHDSGTSGEHLFATSMRSFALAYAGAEWNDFEINQSRVNGVMYLTEILPGKFREIFNRPGYIHILPADSFKNLHGVEYISDEDVRVKKTYKINNVLKELQKASDVKLYYYPDLPPFIQDREQYLRDLAIKYNYDADKVLSMAKELRIDESASAAVEDTTELHEMSPKDKQAIANKYGLRTPGEYQQDGQDKTQERVNQRREKQLKDLKKARKIKKRKAFVRKVKSHLPGAQNESAMGILSMPKVVSSPPFDIDDKVDLYVGLANKKINEYEKTAKNIPVPKRKFKKNPNKNRAVPDYYLKLWFNPDRASNLLINDAAPNQHTIWLYPDEYCTLMFVCADDVCRVYMLDSYIAGDYHQFLGAFQVDMGIGARLKAALKEDSSSVDDSESDHYEADATDRDPLWGDRNHFFKHPNAMDQDYDKSIQESSSTKIAGSNLTVRKTDTTNPNDSVSSKAVKLNFYNGKDRVGTAGVSGYDTRKGFLYDLEVMKKYRGKGYGKRILDYVIKNYSVTDLSVAADNDVAINMYKKAGFRIKKTFDSNGENGYEKGKFHWMQRRSSGSLSESFVPYIDTSIQENYKFELVDKNLRFVDRLDEAATKNQKLYPVYVVLVHSGTGVSKAIKAISHSEYSHASICFDSSLDKMYSFARKDPRNPFIGGFRYESIGKGFYEQKEIPYAVYVVPCTESQVKKMKKRLNYFIQNQEKFTFDFTGLVTNYLGIVNNPAHRWFCSRFVADILNAGAPKNNPYVAEPSLQDPDDFKDTDWAIYVDSGENLMKYDRKKVDRKTNQIIRKEMLRRMAVNESAIFDLDAFNPFIESTLNYQFAMMDEAAVDDFVRYLKSFKVKFDKEGNVIISRREVDQLDKHFRQSLRMIKAYENAGDLDSVKLELCKINYMIELINEYYLSPKAMKSKRVKADLRKEMLDLRSVMLNAFSQHLKYVKTMDPAFNFKSYYDTSIYGKNIEIPKPVLSAIGKAIVTRL